MFAAHAGSVLFVIVRMCIAVSSDHGSIMPAMPNPNTKYASSNVIAICDDASGTAITYACTGPKLRFTVAGGAWVVHALLNSAEFAMSGTLPPVGIVHVSVADD